MNWQLAKFVAKDSEYHGETIWVEGKPQRSKQRADKLVLLSNVTGGNSPWPDRRKTVDYDRVELLPTFADHQPLLTFNDWRKEQCESKQLGWLSRWLWPRR